MRWLAVLLAAGLALVACTSSSPAKRSSAPAPRSSAYSPAAGDDAAVIATHIPGCAMVLPGDVRGGAPDMTSTATCVLEAHMVIVDVWGPPASSAIPAELTKGRPAVTYALGDHWTAFLADEGATPETTTLQEQLTNDAVGLLGASHAPVPAGTQKSITAVIARALGGKTVST